MKSTIQHAPLNEAQLYLVKMFAVMDSESDFDELKSLLLDFFHKKLDEETDRLWEEGKINSETIEGIMHGHDRTGDEA